MPDTEKLILRSSRKMFMGVGSANSSEFQRLRGFTALSESKNPVEYSRKYVDETFETVDVTGMSPSFDFTYDAMTPNEVLDDISSIIDEEKLGTDAVRAFVSVDFHHPMGDGFRATMRLFSVIGSTVGDGTDALTYSGTLKVKGAPINGMAVISAPEYGNSENVEAVTFTSETELENA